MLNLPISNGDELHAALAAQFTSEDLEWKVQTCGKTNNKFWAKIVPYLSARAIQARLDEVVGPGGWRNRHEPIVRGGEVVGFLCYLALRIDGEWIEKCDGAELTDIESIKGGISNSLKRCAVQWGLGRYLYAVPVCWAQINADGSERAKTKDGEWFSWDPPAVSADHQESHQGNGQAPRQQPAPAASPTAPTTPGSSTTATAPTEPTQAELKASQQRAAEAKRVIDEGLAAKAAARAEDAKRITVAYNRAVGATSRDEALECIGVIAGDGITKPADVPADKVQPLIDALDRLAGIEVEA